MGWGSGGVGGIQNPGTMLGIQAGISRGFLDCPWPGLLYYGSDSLASWSGCLKRLIPAHCRTTWKHHWEGCGGRLERCSGLLDRWEVSQSSCTLLLLHFLLLQHFLYCNELIHFPCLGIYFFVKQKEVEYWQLQNLV